MIIRIRDLKLNKTVYVGSDVKKAMECYDNYDWSECGEWKPEIRELITDTLLTYSQFNKLYRERTSRS